MLHILEGGDLTKAIDFSEMWSYLYMTGIMRHPDYHHLSLTPCGLVEIYRLFPKKHAVSFFRPEII